MKLPVKICVFLVGVVFSFLISYSAYENSEPSLATLSGAILLFGCMSLFVAFAVWPKGQKSSTYSSSFLGMGSLSKRQIVFFLCWFLIGGLVSTLLWLNNL